MFKKEFLKAVAERAIKTFVQVMAAATGGSYVNLFHLSFNTSWKLAIGGALLSILSSFGSSKIGNNGPSLVGEVVDAATPLVTHLLESKGLVQAEPTAVKVDPKVVEDVIKKTVKKNPTAESK